jgi:hypothetical protein
MPAPLANGGFARRFQTFGPTDRYYSAIRRRSVTMRMAAVAELSG